MTKIEGVSAYPLSWPKGWRRTVPHLRKDGAEFKGGDPYQMIGTEKKYVGRKMITFDRARRLLMEELDRLKATSITLSTDIPLRLDGTPRADAFRAKMDPGIAVYFMLKGKQMVMAQDGYDNVAANTRSMGLAIVAMRQLERHGGGTMMERAFSGFAALPPPADMVPRRPWWEVFRYSADPAERELLTFPEVKARFHALAKKHHPDNAGGSQALMMEFNVALEDAEKDLVDNQGGGER